MAARLMQFCTLGAIAGAFMTGRHTRPRHLSGAALMGFGGVTAMGCTIGQGIAGMSTLSLSAPLALAAIFPGAYLGLDVLVEGSRRGAIQSGFARFWCRISGLLAPVIRRRAA